MWLEQKYKDFVVHSFPMSVSEHHMVESVKKEIQRRDYVRLFSAEEHYLAMQLLLRKLSLYAVAEANSLTKDWQLRRFRNEVQQLCYQLKHKISHG